MLKFVFVICAAVALVQQTEAFKVVTIHKGAPAVDPAALIQGAQTAIADKLQQVKTLVGALVQQKVALKQNALNSIQSTLSGIKSQISSLAGNLPPPVVIRKHIYLGVPKAAVPDSTTSFGVEGTTTSD